MSTVCPVCGKDDTIQRLSAIVSSGQASGSFSGPSASVTHVDGKWGTTGGYTTMSGSTTTVLARKLSPPPEPRKGLGFHMLVYLFLAAVLAFFSCGVATGVSLLLFPNLEGDPATVVYGIVLVGLFVGGLTVLQRWSKTWQTNQEARYAKEKPAWDRAMERYDRAYYCFRDDAVFDADTGQTCRPESLREFLYSAG